MVGESQTRAFGERFEAIVRRLPRKPAIEEDGCAIDYATLESTSRAIASRIETAAAGRPGFVALLFSRKAPTVQAMVAALRCGRAYVPLDNADPDERLRFALSDAAPVALLVESGHAARARGLADEDCAVVEVDGGEVPDPAYVLPEVAADALAYVVYTSGSTGTPKGVTQTHRGVTFFADAYFRRLTLGERDRLTLLWVMSFAAVNVHIYGGLLSGATVCAYDMRRDGIAGLAAWLDRERITAIHTFPTVFRGLCATLSPGAKLQHMRVIDIGAEATYTSDVATFREHTNDDAILVNQLGASEADVIAQHVVAHGDTVPPGALLPLGHPTPGVDVRIRRDDGSDADVDEAGAIVVSSPHLSCGYWRRPDLDAQFFSPDPRYPGQRCYVSGDRGRIDGEGRLHFLGRTGSRVKIRGHSVDLTEIEAALAATTGVTRAAALAPIPDRCAEADRIVAYVSVASPAAGDAAALRRSLAGRLPSYMLPAAFVFMDALPTTSTGKVDRVALAQSEPTRAGAASGNATDDPGAPSLRPPAPRSLNTEYIAPRDELEALLQKLWASVLAVAPIGVDDDFLDLGGESLQAFALIARVQRELGTTLSPKDVFTRSSIGAMAALIRERRQERRAR
jgi:amino acid adenylation domain-containing protein